MASKFLAFFSYGAINSMKDMRSQFPSVLKEKKSFHLSLLLLPTIQLIMGLSQGYNWYAKYIAETATQTLLIENTRTKYHPRSLVIHKSVGAGSVLIIESKLAPVAVVLITLIVTIVIPILFGRITKALAVIWCAWHNKSSYGSIEGQYERPDTAFHLPVVLANCGLWTTDIWMAASLSWQGWKHKNINTTLIYLGLVVLCVFGLLTGPATAFVLSHHVETGFGSTIGGICVTPLNFSLGAFNAVSTGVDHHGRAIELLPWLGSFSYYWSNSTVDKYNSAKTSIVDPISGARYSQLDYCLLKDDVLCDSNFNRTHIVTANLTSAQLGLWAGGDYNISMEAACIKMNSTALAYTWSETNSTTDRAWYYAFYAVPDATNLTARRPQYVFGQSDLERFDKRKNVITDSWFVDDDGDLDFNWARDVLPPSIRALDIASFTVLTVLPSALVVNQQPGDELYLPPVGYNDFKYAPNQLAHILCWENTFLSTPSNRSRLTSSRQIGNFTSILKENGLPALLSPLLFFVNNEFVNKPARFLRLNTLLQSVSGDTFGEYVASDAPPVAFGAEMHRWGHVGILDIASKATRIASGYYTRGETLNSSALAIEHSNQDLVDLCNAVREARAGVISIPIKDLVLLLVLLILACSSWIVEMIMVMLAQKGRQGILRLWLILPAAKPTSLNASVALALNNEIVMSNSASGWPLIKLRGREQYLGPIVQVREDGLARLRWGIGGLPKMAEKITFQ
ncbi:hypothetical protein BKA61DRAFT_729275 [Leptodontidium sp. MPI-SDFR-AT-0119]|nr:hypothetical protein BKA61DRAFT_729275 [Leptodontidium sp. MPI-SDFR-AT-0119]